jgi:basic amino acid/polyamine antiporter, APA family
MQIEIQEGLTRAIGIRRLAVSAVNLTIGAGIFALPAVVAGQLGAAAVLAYVICGLLLSLVLLCFVEVGSKLTVSGGVYEYVGLAFGPYAGFLTNMLFAGFALSADAAVANVLLENIAILLPVIKTKWIHITLLIMIFGGIGALNVLGVKQGIRFVEFITLAKIIPLFILIVAGLWFVDPENLRWASTPSIQSLGEAALILFFAFGGGVEATLNATGEIINPVRTIPRGILLGTFAIFAIYLLIQIVSQGVLGGELVNSKEAPLAAVAEKFIGSFGSTLMIIGAAISCFGLISGDILATSRLPYAAARDGLLPQFLAKVHPRLTTPYWAVIVYSGAGLLLAVSGGFRQLAILSSVAILLVYVGVILATIKLRRLKKENAFVIPGGLTIPILALTATGWFLSHLSKPEIVAAVIFLLFFSGVYFFYQAIAPKSKK